MRLLLAVAIVIVYVAIRSKAEPHPPDTEHASPSNYDQCSDEENQRVFERVLDSLGNFTAKYLSIWAKTKGTFVVSPLADFFSVAVFPYETEERMRNEVMKGLGLRDVDPRFALQKLVEIIDLDYFPLGLSKRSKPNISRIITKVSALFRQLRTNSNPYHRLSSHDNSNCYFTFGNFQWLLWIASNRPLHTAKFFASNGVVVRQDYIHQEGYFRYGELPELNCTFVQAVSKKRDRVGTYRVTVVRSNDQQGYQQLKNHVGVMDFKKLSSFPIEYCDSYMPDIRVRTESTPDRWASQVLQSGNLFEPDEARPNLFSSSSMFGPEDFTRNFSLKVTGEREHRDYRKSHHSLGRFIQKNKIERIYSANDVSTIETR